MSETNISLIENQLNLDELTFGRSAYGLDLFDMRKQLVHHVGELGLIDVNIMEAYPFNENKDDYNHDAQIVEPSKHFLTIIRQSEIRSNISTFNGIVKKGYGAKDMVNEIRAGSFALSARRTIKVDKFNFDKGPDSSPLYRVYLLPEFSDRSPMHDDKNELIALIAMLNDQNSDELLWQSFVPSLHICDISKENDPKKVLEFLREVKSLGKLTIHLDPISASTNA